MIKTQVQIPEALYKRVKEIARQREMSLAEVMRRGLEYMSRTHPAISGKPFQLPVVPAGAFAKDFDELDLDAIAAEEELRSVS